MHCNNPCPPPPVCAQTPTAGDACAPFARTKQTKQGTRLRGRHAARFEMRARPASDASALLWQCLHYTKLWKHA